MPSVFVDLDATGNWFVFNSPFKRDFVDELKARVPAPNRRWVPEGRAWCVTRTYWETAQSLLYKHYGDDLTIHLGPGAEAAQIDLTVRGETYDPPVSTDYAILGIRADAPECVVHAAYLALETCWADPGVQNVGLYSLDQTRQAYTTICASRGIPQEPPPALAALFAVRNDPANYEKLDDEQPEYQEYKDQWQ